MINMNIFLTCIFRDIPYNYANIREFTPFSIRENKQRKTLTGAR